MVIDKFESQFWCIFGMNLQLQVDEQMGVSLYEPALSSLDIHPIATPGRTETYRIRLRLSCLQYCERCIKFSRFRTNAQSSPHCRMSHRHRVRSSMGYW